MEPKANQEHPEQMEPKAAKAKVVNHLLSIQMAMVPQTQVLILQLKAILFRNQHQDQKRYQMEQKWPIQPVIQDLLVQKDQVKAKNGGGKNHETAGKIKRVEHLDQKGM
jgi:hypothetical protein